MLNFQIEIIFFELYILLYIITADIETFLKHYLYVFFAQVVPEI